MKRTLIVIFFFFTSMAWADWSVDFSRRTNELKSQDYYAEKSEKKDKSIFESVFEPSAPVQEVVLLSTESGFVPSTLRVREGTNYRVHVVNINEKERNVSFVLDSFSQHHATYYGKTKTFMISPKKQGIYSFQCPETSAQGRLVVYPGKNSPVDDLEMRQPASEM